MNKQELQQKIFELSKRADSIKSDPGLRHQPDSHDVAKASENARFMMGHQYQAMKPERGDS